MTPLILPYRGEYAPEGIAPTIHTQAFIAANATIIGDVHIGNDSGIWYGCIVRGDVNYIRIGERTNIQDGTVIHVTRNTGPTLIGDDVTIGHLAMLHACTLENRCFIGMGATVMDDVVVETDAMVAADALVTPGKRVQSGQLWAGSPAKHMRDLKEEEIKHIQTSSDNYVRLAREHMRIND